jgi:hypothetical protein
LLIFGCAGPDGKGKTWKTGGKTYQLSCGMCNCGNDQWPSEAVQGRSACATRCAAVDGCHSVDYAGGLCCFKTRSTAPTDVNAAVDNVRITGSAICSSSFLSHLLITSDIFLHHIIYSFHPEKKPRKYIADISVF